MLVLTAPGLAPLDLDAWDEGITTPSVEVGGPADRPVAYDRPHADGDDDDTRYEGPRVMTIGVAISEGTHTRRALLDRMAEFMHCSTRITIDYARNGDAPRRLTVRPQPVSVVWDNPGVMDLAWSFKTVGSPYWQGEDRTTDLAPKPPPPGRTYPRLGAYWDYPPPPEGQTIQVVNAGNLPADWVWTIHGPVVGPCLRNEDTSEEVSLPGLTLAGGQVAVVDSATRMVEVDGQSRFSALDWTTTTWWKVPPGTTTVSMPVSSSSDPAWGSLAFTDLFHS